MISAPTFTFIRPIHMLQNKDVPLPVRVFFNTSFYLSSIPWQKPVFFLSGTFIDTSADEYSKLGWKESRLLQVGLFIYAAAFKYLRWTGRLARSLFAFLPKILVSLAGRKNYFASVKKANEAGEFPKALRPLWRKVDQIFFAIESNELEPLGLKSTLEKAPVLIAFEQYFLAIEHLSIRARPAEIGSAENLLTTKETALGEEDYATIKNALEKLNWVPNHKVKP